MQGRAISQKISIGLEWLRNLLKRGRGAIELLDA